jgi:hypothetical protein
VANDRQKILRAINREGRKIRDPNARRVFLRAAVETGIVESGLSNPSGGDADSAGWRQERASLYANPTNIKASARRFRQEFQQHYDPGEASYEVAAQVQRPAAQYRGRYRDVASEAERVVQSELGGAPNVREGSGDLGVQQYRTVPGTDRSADRQALRVNYLSERGKPGALLSLAAGLNEAVDSPDRKVKVQGSAPRQDSTKTSGAGKGPLHELFYGQLALKEGQAVAPVSGHDDHVHVAADPKETIRLGKLAQRMGLVVRENPYFDKVDPVHVKGSFHYSKRAIDVSGDPKKLARYAKRVRRLHNV